jgi:hypothetical protein
MSRAEHVYCLWYDKTANNFACKFQERHPYRWGTVAELCIEETEHEDVAWCKDEVF